MLWSVACTKALKYWNKEHVLKIFERIVEVRAREKVTINIMQMGCMEGKGTTEAIFIVRQLQEKYILKKRGLCMTFVDLEKAFDRVLC